MNCLFSKPQGEKLELMANKVQNKGAGGGVFYLSCSLLSPSPDSVASSPSLLSSSLPRHSLTRHFSLYPLSVTSSVERFSWRHF